MTETEWINKTAIRYGVGGDPNVHAMMKVALDFGQERFAQVAESFKPGFCGDAKDVIRHDLVDAIALAIRRADGSET